ncbi:MAG: ABC transporter permease [Actinomycetota bacterium]
MKALALGALNLRRLLRQRANIFFVFIFPMTLILVLGAAFGGSFKPRIGVVGRGGALGDELVTMLEKSEGVSVERLARESAARTAVERGRLQGALAIPVDYDSALRSGAETTLRYFARPDQSAGQLRTTVEAVVARQSNLVRAARFAQAEGLGSFDQGLASATKVAASMPGVEVEVTTTGRAIYPEAAGRFGMSAATELVLFVFLTSLMGSMALIETRRLGITRRMLSTPTSTRTVILGEGIGRLSVAVVQGVFIMLGSLVMFGVKWGDPLGAAVLLAVFALVGAGAGMFMGAVLRTEQQANAIGILAGLGFGALGGCMVPMEVFSPTVKIVAHLTPHAWANDGFAKLVGHHAALADILPQVGVLSAYAVVLLGLAAWLLRRAITA